MNLIRECIKGLGSRQPVLMLGLGLCAALASSATLEGALWMSLVITVLLVCVNGIVALTRNLLRPTASLLLCVITSTSLVTAAELLLRLHRPEVGQTLGLYLPLAAVSSIVVRGAMDFAAIRGFAASLADGLGMGLGFTAALIPAAALREIIGANRLLGYTVIPDFEPAALVGAAPGAFIVMGLVMWAARAVLARGGEE